MSSDGSDKSRSTVSSTTYSKKEMETLRKSFLSPPKLSVNYKKRRKTRDSLVSKAKKSKTESSSSADNIYSSTFTRALTTSSSKSSKSSFKPKTHKKISFSPIQKCFPATFGSEINLSPCLLNKNEEKLTILLPKTELNESKDQFQQPNELKAVKSFVTSDEETLVGYISSLSTTSEEELIDYKDFSVKKPEHIVKKKGFKQVKKGSNYLKKSKYPSIRSMDKNRIFPKYYPLGWMAIYNVGSKILENFMFSEKSISHRNSTFIPYSKWKQMSKEGLLEEPLIPQNKGDIYSMPIEKTERKKRVPQIKKEQQSLKEEKKHYFTKSIKEDILQSEQIREASSVSNKTSGVQNLSYDIIRNVTNKSIVKKQETSETSNNLKNRIHVISDIEFESSTKIYIPPEILRQYRYTVKTYN